MSTYKYAFIQKTNLNENLLKNFSTENYTSPLAYLFENNDIQSMYTVALDSLSMDDTISHMCYATNVQPSSEVDGELLIGAKNLYFIATHITEKNVKIISSKKQRCQVTTKNANFFFLIFRSQLQKPINFL